MFNFWNGRKKDFSQFDLNLLKDKSIQIGVGTKKQSEVKFGGETRQEWEKKNLNSFKLSLPSIAFRREVSARCGLSCCA